MAARAAQLAHALARLGVRRGERVATLGWNTAPHMEVYYAASGMGAVLHTVNPRLFPDQIAYILNDAADVALFVDASLLPGLMALAERLPETLRLVVVMGEAALPALRVPVVGYEALIAGEDTEYPWPLLDERAASALCYTSGTTGEPKGVLYSHRSTVLHAMAAVQPDVFALRALDVVMPVEEEVLGIMLDQ
jgi:fatty-acyl-CoA synthase